MYNLRGDLRLLARVDNSVPPGVVSAHLDWARTSPDGKNINVLTSDRLTDMGRGATFYSVLVEVEKVYRAVIYQDRIACWISSSG